jgi:HK97 family phage prohead protease
MTDIMYKALTGAPRSIDKAARTLAAMVSTEQMDRQGDVLLAAGCNAAAYLANPVLLWNHDAKIPPIGKALVVTAKPGEGVEAGFQFADTPFAREVFDLYAGGYLAGFSVGFQPTGYSGRTEKGGQVIAGWELREVSACPLPVNPGALVKAAQDGSDAAVLLLRAYYPEAKDENAAARVASDMRRLSSAAESLRNHVRHCIKAQVEPDFDRERLDRAMTDLAEVIGVRVATLALDERHTKSEGEPSVTAEPEPNPAVGALSEQQAAQLTEAVKALVAQATRTPDLVASLAADAVRRDRQRLIGARSL